LSSDRPYDRSATRAAIDLVGLASRSQKFVSSWLSAWQGNQLPTPAGFPPERLQNLKKFVLTCTVNADASAKIIFAGQEVNRISGAEAGLDWFSLVPSREMPERLRRTASVTQGALLRTVREVRLKRGKKYTFEMVTVPLRPDKDGSVQVANFFDWNPPDKKAVLQSLSEIATRPVLAEFIPIVRSQTTAIAMGNSERELQGDERLKVMSQAAVRLVMNFMAGAMKTYASTGLDPADYLIVIAVDSGNVSHVESDPNISLRYAGLIEPDWMRRGVRRAAISRITHIPLETVRRRINRLIEKGILAERRDGVIVSSNGPADLVSRTAEMRFNALLIEQLAADLQMRGIFFR
jgi:hypothetical protein